MENFKLNCEIRIHYEFLQASSTCTTGGSAGNPFIVTVSNDLLLVLFHDECSAFRWYFCFENKNVLHLLSYQLSIYRDQKEHYAIDEISIEKLWHRAMLQNT